MDYVNGCFCNLETGCHPVCKEYNMSLENSISINSMQIGAIGSNTVVGGSYITGPTVVKQNLDMNKVKYDWCYDVLIKINEVIQSNSSDQDKLHAIAWFTKQGLK